MSFLQRLFGGAGRSLDELAQRLGVDRSGLQSIRTEYRRVEIPKRSGDKRVLQIPCDELLKIQKRLNVVLFRRLKAHPAAMGFERGLCAARHAALHSNKAVVVCMDVKDYFPSTTAKRVERYFREIGWGKEATRLLVKLTTYEGGLPQGAPTSPRLSNLVNRGVDAKLLRLAKNQNATYSRYADDMVFSFEVDDASKIHNIVGGAKLLLRRHGYEIHHKKKLHIRRRHQRQIVTGLVVNNGVRLPRETRRWLRAIVHRRSAGGSATLSEVQLKGWKGYLDDLARVSQ